MFWTQFLNGLRNRRLVGVDKVISDAYHGPQATIGKTMQGSARQRCKARLI